MKKNVVILVAGVTLVGVAATVLWLDLRSERTQASELAARIAALEAAPAVQTVAPEASRPVTLPVPPREVAAAGSSASAPQAPTQAAAAPPAGLLDAMSTPQGLEFASAMMRGMMGQMYPDIGEEMGLDPQEVDAFFDLLSRQQQEVTVDSLGLLSGNVQDPAERRDIQRKLQEREHEHAAELAAHLGARHAKWEQYQATTAARQQVNELKTSLATGAEPLSEEQYGKLVAAFAGEQKRIATEQREWSQSAAALDSPNMMQETMQRTVASQRRLLDVARPHLSAAQEAQYRRQVEQQMSMLQAVMGMMNPGQGSPGPAPMPAAGAR